MFYCARENMKTTVIICLCGQRVDGQTSMWHRSSGIVGGNF